MFPPKVSAYCNVFPFQAIQNYIQEHLIVTYSLFGVEMQVPGHSSVGKLPFQVDVM